MYVPVTNVAYVLQGYTSCVCVCVPGLIFSNSDESARKT